MVLHVIQNGSEHTLPYNGDVHEPPAGSKKMCIYAGGQTYDFGFVTNSTYAESGMPLRLNIGGSVVCIGKKISASSRSSSSTKESTYTSSVVPSTTSITTQSNIYSSNSSQTIYTSKQTIRYAATKQSVYSTYSKYSLDTKISIKSTNIWSIYWSITSGAYAGDTGVRTTTGYTGSYTQLQSGSTQTTSKYANTASSSKSTTSISTSSKTDNYWPVSGIQAKGSYYYTSSTHLTSTCSTYACTSTRSVKSTNYKLSNKSFSITDVSYFTHDFC